MEKKAKILLISLITGTILLSAGFILHFLFDKAGLLIHARMPEFGGWSVNSLNMTAGDPLKLRLVSDDVVHGFAIGLSDASEILLIPGEIQTTELLFEEPGEYTFYCTRWCGPNHWRMRGTIHVSGESEKKPVKEQPLFLQLGLDIDNRQPAMNYPDSPPNRLDTPSESIPQLNTETLWIESPEERFEQYRSLENFPIEKSQMLWALVAEEYAQLTTQSGLAEAETLYTEQCAACHGENGNGKGVIVANLPPYQSSSAHAQQLRQPPDFSDPRVLTSASPAVLEGKIIRGGMGTGMPYWGNIYTEEQIKNLVIYLYTFYLLQEVIE